MKFVIASCALLALNALSSQVNSVEVGDSEIKEKIFPNIIKLLENKGSIRLLTKVNWFEDGKEIETKLVDEAYSMLNNSGRMIVYKGLMDKEISDLGLFIWSNEVNRTMCSSIKATPMDTGLILPIGCLKEMLRFTKTIIKNEVDVTNKIQRPIELYGMTALLANIIENHADKLIKINMDRTSDDMIDFKLEFGCGCLIEFRFMNKIKKDIIEIKDIEGLIINVFEMIKVEDKMEKGSIIAKFTILKADDSIITDDILALPNGYTCNHGLIELESKRIIKRSIQSKSDFELEFESNDQDDDRLETGPITSDEEFMSLNDDLLSAQIDSKKSGLNACNGRGSCLGKSSGTGALACSGNGSCTGDRSGSGNRSCAGQISCRGQFSGRARNSCSGHGSCSGKNSGHCANSCSKVGSCSEDNSCQ